MSRNLSSAAVVIGTLRVKVALSYNLPVYVQIFPLVGGTSQRWVSGYKSEYLYIHEYLYNKIHITF